MTNYTNPNLSDREISINPSSLLNCKINNEGIIEYVNQQFCEICGYEEFEIIGESIEKLRHPDMPKIFFEVLRERLAKRESMRLIAKFLAKDGRYYWLMTDFDTKVNNAGEVQAHYNRSIAAPSFAVHKISSIYKILSKIEAKTGNTKTSERYLVGFLEERNLTYNEYIEDLCVSRLEYENPPIAQPNVSQQSQSPFQNQSFNTNIDLLHSNSNVLATKPEPEPEAPNKKKSLFQRIFGKG